MNDIKDLLFLVQDGRIIAPSITFWFILFVVVWTLWAFAFGFTDRNTTPPEIGFYAFLVSILTMIVIMIIFLLISELGWLLPIIVGTILLPLTAAWLGQQFSPNRDPK